MAGLAPVSHSVRRAVRLAAILMVTLAGCSGAGPPAFTTVFPAPTGSLDGKPVTVSLIDQTGLVTGIAVAPIVAGESDVAVAPGLVNGLRMYWLAGECDDRETLVFTDAGRSYELTIHTHEGIAAFTCTAAGVPRALDITFSETIEPELVSLNVQYP